MLINPTQLRMLSMLGQRGSFGLAMCELAKSNSLVVGLTADLCNTSGLERFRNSYPDQFYNVGIAEQNLVGVAAGLAAEGRIPFATTFANFAALRAHEQVRHFMGYMRENVKLVGFGAGFSFGMFGVTHYGLEDVAAMRVIPNLAVVAPADGLSVVKAVEAAAEWNGPVYLRLSGTTNNPIVYRDDFAFTLGKAISLTEGGDVSIVASGSMVAEALKASTILEERGVSSGVVDMHTIQPLDTELLDRLFATHKLIVTVEEHFIAGGLGSAIAEYMADKSTVARHVMLGVKNEFKHAGSYPYMLEQFELTANKIADKISEILPER